MAQEDNYKEGVDYVMVDKGGYKTRHFLTKAEKAAKNAPAPKAEAPKAKAKPKLSGIKTPAVTTKKLDQSVRPTGKAAGMPAAKAPGMVDRIMRASGRAGTAVGNAVGGAGANFNKYVSDAIDRASKPGDGGDMPKVDTMGNATGYKKGGMMKEGSAKDMREDKIKAKKAGMSMKKWESSAADKKHDAPKKMATGGSVRGTGAAVRGKGFAGTF